MTHVLLLTTEPLPFRGMITTGAGLRAWGLAEGLRSAGLEVTVAMPQEAVEGKSIHDEAFSPKKNLFQRHLLDEFINTTKPDVIVFQHWGLMIHLKQTPCPVALDLAGPHLLERYYWSGAASSPPDPQKTFNMDFEKNLAEKLHALRLADFVTCSGKFQRFYFLPFLAMAGYPVNTDTLPIIPFSIDPNPPAGRNNIQRNPETFVYGGMFLPWQNPERQLNWLLETFDEVKRGKLLFFGGMHPTLDVSGGKFERLLKRLEGHSRVVMSGLIPFHELCEKYIHAGVALDLCDRNPERELAFTTRTIVYLWCGLPVIYNNYAELSEYISASGAGWCLDPDDEKGFKDTVRNILEGKANLEEKGESALRLIRERFDWTKTIRPLTDFCSSPYYRKGKGGALLAFENQSHRIDDLRRRLDETQRELLTLKGKLWYRLYKKTGQLRPFLAPLVFLLSLPVCLFLLFAVLVNDLFSSKKGR